MRIFLSYAEEDSRIADAIVGVLDRSSQDIFNWRDPRRRGLRFRREIERGIRNADAFIALLSPSFLRSYWCGLELDMAHQREQDMQSDHPESAFINVVLVAAVRPVEAGVLGSYDWLDMTSTDKVKDGLPELSDRFGEVVRPEQAPAVSRGVSGLAAPGSSQEDGTSPSRGYNPAFRNRDDELHKVLLGLASSSGPHFWLVVAPPQLGKSWFLHRVSADRSLAEPVPWVVHSLDVWSEPSTVRGDAAKLLSRLFGQESSRAMDQEPLPLRAIAQSISNSERPHLCLLDSAELLSEETAKALRGDLSEIYNLVQNTPKRGIRLALIVASRRADREWKGVIPKPALTPLPLTEFTEDVVQQTLYDLAVANRVDFSAGELRSNANRVHRLTQGLPALLVRCLRWIQAEDFVDLGRLARPDLFAQLVYPYVEEELLTSAGLLQSEQEGAREPLEALSQAYRVLAPYRLFTQSHLRHHHDQDAEFRAALAAASWNMEDLWAAISATSLLRRPLDEPWQEIHAAIRRLLYRYFYRTEEECAEAHYEARKFVEGWTEGQTGTEQPVGLVECVWHEANTFGHGNSAEKTSSLAESARKLSRDIRESSAYMPRELRGFAVDRMRSDEELQEAVGNLALFNRLVEIVAEPEES
jgi:hypothetical protein